MTLTEAFSTYRPYKKKYKTIAASAPWEIPPDFTVLQAIADGRLLERRSKGFSIFVDGMAADRFSANSGYSFKNLRATTNYHAY